MSSFQQLDFRHFGKSGQFRAVLRKFSFGQLLYSERCVGHFGQFGAVLRGRSSVVDFGAIRTNLDFLEQCCTIFVST